MGQVVCVDTICSVHHGVLTFKMVRVRYRLLIVLERITVCSVTCVCSICTHDTNLSLLASCSQDFLIASRCKKLARSDITPMTRCLMESSKIQKIANNDTSAVCQQNMNRHTPTNRNRTFASLVRSN